MNIKRASAIYSGGGIYLYYGELDNGNWIMGSDEGLLIVDTSPLADDETYYNSDYPDWQEKHLVEYIDDDKFQEVLKELVDVILQGNSIDEYDNFDIDELKERVRGSVMERLFINANRNGYGPEQCGTTMTVGELIEYLEQFDETTEVFLKNDNGYTYGSINEYDFELGEE